MSSPGDPGRGAPEDPFDRPPNESGRPPEREQAAYPTYPTDPTAPIQPGAYPGSYPGSEPADRTREQPGYWEQQAAQQQGGQQQGQPPPAYGQSPYGQAPHGQNPYGQGYTPAQPQPAYGYGAPAYGYALAPAHPSATTSLVLGLVGLIGGLAACGLPLLVAPFAIVVGRKTMREIDASNGQLGGRSNAKAGFVMGIIGTALLVLAILAVVLLVIGISVSSSSSGGYTEY